MIYLLDTVCADYGIANILYIIKKSLTIIQIIGPILTIIALWINFTKMTANPDEKKYQKNIFNCLISTVLLFLIPIIVNAVMQILANTGISGITDIPTCWQDAETIHNQIVNKP